MKGGYVKPSVGYDGHGDAEEAYPADGEENEGIVIFVHDEVVAGHVIEEEHVAENMGAGGVELAAVIVQLEDGNSSSYAGYQASTRCLATVNVLATKAFGASCCDASGLGSFDSYLVVTQEFIVS
ncbi:uncharacterized protein [Lolium perenne]|uniref:uncharacterized protein isoform X2 n=1 Tax=Lolium perenne TaxID=4522 RepID=UPI003A996300